MKSTPDMAALDSLVSSAPDKSAPDKSAPVDDEETSEKGDAESLLDAIEAKLAKLREIFATE